MEGHLSVVELPGPDPIAVQTTHDVAQECQACGGDRADVSGADNRNLVAWMHGLGPEPKRRCRA